VPSSTSNFDAQETPVVSRTRPPIKWRGTWVWTVIMTVVVLYAWEGFLRSHGHKPNVVDDPALWSFQRDRLAQEIQTDPNKIIVCLGDCRMELGFVPELLRNRFPEYRVFQLSLEATSPMAVLRDLAETTSFSGVVLCGMTAREFSDDMWDSMQPYVDYYHQQYTWNTAINRRFSGVVQQQLAFVNPLLRLDEVLVHWYRHERLPDPYYIETHFDRSRFADYAHVDLDKHQAWTMKRILHYTSNDPPSPEEWLQSARRAEDYVTAIGQRGGRVAFIRFPTSGRHYKREQLALPREDFWDAFAAETAATSVYFEDYPALSGFTCPDLSHLDRRDAPVFTLALVQILEQEGVLPPSPWEPQTPVPAESPPGGFPDDFNPFEQDGDLPADFNPFETDGDLPLSGSAGQP
jgi:hypothetical protein